MNKKIILTIGILIAAAVLICFLLFRLIPKPGTTNKSQGQFPQLSGDVLILKDSQENIVTQQILPPDFKNGSLVDYDDNQVLIKSNDESKYVIINYKTKTTTNLEDNIISAKFINKNTLVKQLSLGEETSQIVIADNQNQNSKQVAEVPFVYPLAFIGMHGDILFYNFDPTDTSNATVYSVNVESSTITTVAENLGYRMVLNPDGSQIYYNYFDSKGSQLRTGLLTLATKKMVPLKEDIVLSKYAWYKNQLISLTFNKGKYYPVQITNTQIHYINNSGYTDVDSIHITGTSLLLVTYNGSIEVNLPDSQ